MVLCCGHKSVPSSTLFPSRRPTSRIFKPLEPLCGMTPSTNSAPVGVQQGLARYHSVRCLFSYGSSDSIVKNWLTRPTMLSMTWPSGLPSARLSSTPSVSPLHPTHHRQQHQLRHPLLPVLPGIMGPTVRQPIPLTSISNSTSAIMMTSSLKNNGTLGTTPSRPLPRHLATVIYVTLSLKYLLMVPLSGQSGITNNATYTPSS